VRSMWSRHHILGCRFSELDLAQRVGKRRVFLAWASKSRRAVLAVLGGLEGELLAIGIAIDINVRDAHCERWLVGERICLVDWCC
jgi:hypothetical protein